MKKSLMQLSKFFIKSLNIEWINGEKQDTSVKTLELGFDFDIVRHQEHDNQFKLEFRVITFPADDFCGIKVEAQVDGFFYFPKGTKEEEMHYLVALNGSSMLYSLLRGQLALITGGFPQGKFTLPAVVMEEIISEIVKAKQEELEKRKKQQKKISTKPNRNKSKKKASSK